MPPLKYNLPDRTRGPLHTALWGPSCIVSEHGTAVPTRSFWGLLPTDVPFPFLQYGRETKQDAQVILEIEPEL